MKTIQLLFIAMLAMGMNISCSSQTKTKEESQAGTIAEKVDVYYFHYTKRCATCNAVESVSKEAIADLYGEKVSFADYNLDEQKGEDKGNELEISGQTLLIVYEQYLTLKYTLFIRSKF